MSNWHPGAKRAAYPDAGPYALSAPPKLVWHTTEGVGLPRYSGSAPHFTLDPKTGELWQHVSIDRASMALLHPPGTVHTNHAHAIQVELIGSAKDTPTWPDFYYRNIAKLARWIEANAGVPRRCTVEFRVGVPRLGSTAWVAYSGHLGHEHVPANEHWDPGAFKIDKVLDLPVRAAATRKARVNAVAALQRARRLIRRKRLKRAARSVGLALGAIRRKK